MSMLLAVTLSTHHISDLNFRPGRLRLGNSVSYAQLIDSTGYPSAISRLLIAGTAIALEVALKPSRTVSMHMKQPISLVAILALTMIASLGNAEAAGASKIVTKAMIQRAMVRDAAVQRALAKDLATHAAVPVRPLARDIRVWRYTTLSQARVEARRGIAPNSHMTARVSPGRLPSSQMARARYGLIKAPTARMTVQLEKGFPVRRNKAVMGAPGIGEVTSNVRVPPQAVVKIQALPK